MTLAPNMSLLELQQWLEDKERAQPARYPLTDTDMQWLSDVTQLARELTSAPIAFVSVLDASTTHFVASQGAGLGLGLRSERRRNTLCDLVASTGNAVVIADALSEPALARFPAVQDGLRSYIGVPIAHDADAPLAFALCVADTSARPDAADGVHALQRLARVAHRALSR